MSPPTVSDVHTAGTRQLAVLATVAAAVSLGALLVGGSAVGLAVGGRPLALLLGVATMVAFALARGWPPGLYIGLVGLVVATFAFGPMVDAATGADAPWAPTVVLAVTVLIVHEAARFSFEARRPTRLGRLVLRRTITSVSLVGVAALAAAVLVRAVSEVEASRLWMPISFATMTGPLLASRLVGQPAGPVGRRLRAGLMAGAAVVLVGIAALGAGYREASMANGTAEAGPSALPETPPPPPEPVFGPQATSDAVATLIGMFVAAAVLGLLYGAFHRRQILLEQDDLELDFDDSSFLFATPDGAELDEAELDSETAAALLRDIRADLDAEPDPGRAIRLAYARVETRLASVGLHPRPEETVGEYLERCLPSLGDGAALAGLTVLFERARFSDEPVPESDRVAARREVEKIESQLAAVAAAAAAAVAEAEASDVPEGSAT